MDFINDCLNISKNKLNISMTEKDKLDDLDDEKVEKEFHNFLNEIQKDHEASEFMNQMNKLLESGIQGDSEKGFLDGFATNTNFDNFT